MRFAVLGPLHVTVGSRSVDIERPRWRSVLAFLLLHNDRPVTTETIVAAIWGERAVPTAATQVHTAVSMLRRKFRALGIDDLIVNRSSGYRMDVRTDRLDVSEFAAAVARARQPGSAEAAMDILRRALNLWRGHALEGISGAYVEAARTRLEEERLRVVEQLMEMELARGNHGDMIAELMGYTEMHPLRESLVRLLILALYRSGRKSDALREYSRIRERLTAELGVEPSPELRELHLEVLQDGPTVRPAVPQRMDRSVVSRGPRALPAPSPVFTGRAAERAEIGHVLAEHGESAATIVAINGPGGAGKSALAVQAAHDVGRGYPRGQIYIDLQGSSPGLAPLTALEVLRRCLQCLGTPAADIPAEEAAAAQRLRELSDGGLLIVLDNAVDDDQVAPVIEAVESGGVLITSRARLGLPDARLHLHLDALPPSDAVMLLSRVAGRAEPDEHFNRIAAYCDHLPLALCVAGGRLAREPDLSAERLAAGLADHRNRLTVLEVDGAGVRSSIRAGYDLVAAGSSIADRFAARAFCLIGLLPFPSIDVGVVAAMLCPDEPEMAVSALDRLERSRLITADGVGGYRLHDVVRAAASEYAAETMTADERNQARNEAVRYITACALLADELLRPTRKRVWERHDWTELATPRAVHLAVRVADDVGPWLDRALPNVIAASQLAAESDAEDAQYAVAIARALTWILRKRNDAHRERLLAVNSVRAAERMGDAAVLRRALIHRGRVELYRGDYEGAVTYLERALESARAGADRSAQISALNDLGLVATRRDDLTRARHLLVECVELADDATIPRHTLPTVIHNLAMVEILLGALSEASDLLHRALALREESHDRSGYGSDLVLLGMAACGLGQFEDAGQWLRQGIDICEGLGDRSDSWSGLAALTYAQLESGRHWEAIAVGQRCLATARRLNRPYAEKSAHRLLARAHTAAGEDVDARIHARSAAAISSPPVEPEELVLARLLS